MASTTAPAALETISHDRQVLALILRADVRQAGVQFFTPHSFSQQLAYMAHPAGHVIRPHVHNSVRRQVSLTNEVFGKKDAPVIVSWIVCGHQMGGALAALGGGVMRNATGSYLMAFIGSGAACLIASLLVLRIGRGTAMALAE